LVLLFYQHCVVHAEMVRMFLADHLRLGVSRGRINIATSSRLADESVDFVNILHKSEHPCPPRSEELASVIRKHTSARHGDRMGNVLQSLLRRPVILHGLRRLLLTFNVVMM